MRQATVALISTARGWHGGEAQAALLAHGLRQRGFDCLIFARADEAFAERMVDAGFDVSTFSGRANHPRALWQVRRRLRAIRPEIIHYNDSHAVTTGLFATAGLRIPVRVGARRVVFPIHSAWRYRCACDRVICVSHTVERVCQAGGLNSKHTCVVYDGSDVKRIAAGCRDRGRASLQAQNDDLLLLCVASLTPPKGHADLIVAMSHLHTHHPKLRLVLAGDGPLRAPLQAQANRLGIADRVSFLGYRDDIPDLLQAADAVVTASHEEGLCSSVIDTMLAERPLVTTDIAPILEVIRTSTGLTAATTPAASPTRLAAAIQNLLANPDATQARTARAMRRAMQRFTSDRMVDDTLAVYDELLSSARTRRKHGRPSGSSPFSMKAINDNNGERAA